MANLVEVFSSVQGEGSDVGRSTLFVRYGVCDLRCAWCDSPETWRAAKACRIQLARGSERFREVPNPVALDALCKAAEELDVARHRMVSLTGGEPLLQPDDVAEAAPVLRGYGPEVLLETHGLHREALDRVIDAVDVVSMDWKLTSDVRRATDREGAPVPAFHDEHEAFLATARRAPRVVVKLVITPASGDQEIDEVLRRVARTHPAATLVLQPVTPFGSVTARPSARRMLDLAARAERSLADVRVIPQTHPLYGAP